MGDALTSMAKDFEVLEHTADIGIIAYGADLKQTFAHAARGLLSLITDPDKVNEVTYRDIELTAPDMESLLVDWLNELIYIFDVEYILFKRFDISQLDQNRLKARVYGEKVDLARHEIKLGIKATTYHMLQIVRENGYKAQVIFDI